MDCPYWIISTPKGYLESVRAARRLPLLDNNHPSEQPYRLPLLDNNHPKGIYIDIFSESAGSTPAAPDGIEGAGGCTDSSAVQPKTPKPAKATVTEVSCGGYDEKVVCHEWSAAGKSAPDRFSGAPLAN